MPYESCAALPIARIAALRPGQSPPLVRMPICIALSPCVLERLDFFRSKAFDLDSITVSRKFLLG